MLGVFPQLADLQIPYAWGGFVDITMNKAPDFGRLGHNIYYLHGEMTPRADGARVCAYLGGMAFVQRATSRFVMVLAHVSLASR